MSGVFLDSSVVIQAERLRYSETQMLHSINERMGDQEIAISAIVLTELLHAIYRANTAIVRERRSEFLNQLVEDVPVYPYSQRIAEVAGRIGGQQAAQGEIIPFADLLIGATALFHNYSVLTTNVRHFNLIPGLDVIPF